MSFNEPSQNTADGPDLSAATGNSQTSLDSTTAQSATSRSDTSTGGSNANQQLDDFCQSIMKHEKVIKHEEDGILVYILPKSALSAESHTLLCVGGTAQSGNAPTLLCKAFADTAMGLLDGAKSHKLTPDQKDSVESSLLSLKSQIDKGTPATVESYRWGVAGDVFAVKTDGTIWLYGADANKCGCPIGRFADESTRSLVLQVGGKPVDSVAFFR
jgi:hypothetical protein